MIELRDNYWAVEVPDGAEVLRIGKSVRNSNRLYYDMPYAAIERQSIDLPPGSWQIVCTLKDASYTHAAEIVESVGDGFKDYNKDNFHHDLPLMSPFDSLRSLLTVKGCDSNKDYLIIKKIV